MSEIPSEFISKKTFRSLPQLAFWTWLIVFIIDAVVLQRFSCSYARVAAVWIIGLIVSCLFEFARYRNLNKVEKEGYGNRFLLLLNAFLIFMYASSYTGLTKQIGAWGEVQSIVTVQKKRVIKSGILLEAIEWSVPILAKQTSYFPDVTAMAETKRLEQENRLLRDSLSSSSDTAASGSYNQLIAGLNDRIHKLENDLINCRRNNNNPATDAALARENENLTTENNNLNSQISQLKQINANLNTETYKQMYLEILKRVKNFNTRQAKWSALPLNNSRDKRPLIKENVNSLMMALDPNETDFYDFLFNTPINTASYIKAKK